MKTLTRLNEDFKISHKTQVQKPNIVFVRSSDYKDLTNLQLTYNDVFGFVTLPIDDEEKRNVKFRWGGISVVAAPEIKKHKWTNIDEILWLFNRENIELNLNNHYNISYEYHHYTYDLVVYPTYIDKSKLVELTNRNILALNYGNDTMTYVTIIKDFIRRGFLS